MNMNSFYTSVLSGNKEKKIEDPREWKMGERRRGIRIPMSLMSEEKREKRKRGNGQTFHAFHLTFFVRFLQAFSPIFSEVQREFWIEIQRERGRPNLIKRTNLQRRRKEEGEGSNRIPSHFEERTIWWRMHLSISLVLSTTNRLESVWNGETALLKRERCKETKDKDDNFNLLLLIPPSVIEKWKEREREKRPLSYSNEFQLKTATFHASFIVKPSFELRLFPWTSFGSRKTAVNLGRSL